MLNRLLYGYLGICTYLFIREIYRLYKKDSLELLDELLNKNKASDIKAIFSLKTLRVFVICAFIITFPILPIFETIEIVSNYLKKCNDK